MTDLGASLVQIVIFGLAVQYIAHLWQERSYEQRKLLEEHQKDIDLMGSLWEEFEQSASLRVTTLYNYLASLNTEREIESSREQYIKAKDAWNKRFSSFSIRFNHHFDYQTAVDLDNLQKEFYYIHNLLRSYIKNPDHDLYVEIWHSNNRARQSSEFFSKMIYNKVREKKLWAYKYLDGYDLVRENNYQRFSRMYLLKRLFVPDS